MAAQLIDGKQLAATIRGEVAIAARATFEATGRKPGLAAVLVGDNPASQVYVRNKRKACDEVGIASWLHHLPATTSQTDLLDLVAKLNADPQVHGILVQMPLPPQINEAKVVEAVSPLKDVDGFGPENLGLLATGHPRYLACTPHGVQQLLLRNNFQVAGAHVVILGRSNIVGKPLALILLQKAAGANATVTICHSQSRNISALTRQADILVAAIGQAHFVKADMVKPGAVVIDVGTNRLPDGRLTGDVDFDAVKQVAAAITPVPGGVGPMTIAMLLYNTVQAAKLIATLPGS
jgi:methylenetetrahydrofolate dehydrogenase (NADP+)/methenyltetrahydrofolate cyclohydrolase